MCDHKVPRASISAGDILAKVSVEFIIASIVWIYLYLVNRDQEKPCQKQGFWKFCFSGFHPQQASSGHCVNVVVGVYRFCLI